MTTRVVGFISSMRALSKYCTSREPAGTSTYGSRCSSLAKESGPQKFGVTASPCCHCFWKSGLAKLVAALTYDAGRAMDIAEAFREVTRLAVPPSP